MFPSPFLPIRTLLSSSSFLIKYPLLRFFKLSLRAFPYTNTFFFPFPFKLILIRLFLFELILCSLSLSEHLSSPFLFKDILLVFSYSKSPFARFPYPNFIFFLFDLQARSSHFRIRTPLSLFFPILTPLSYPFLFKHPILWFFYPKFPFSFFPIWNPLSYPFQM